MNRLPKPSGIPSRSRIPSIGSRQNSNIDMSRKFASITAAVLDDEKRLYEEVDQLKESHSNELDRLRSEIEQINTWNAQLTEVVVGKFSNWIDRFDNNFVEFFESQAQLAVAFGKKIDQLQKRFAGFASKAHLQAQIEQFETEKQQFAAMVEQVDSQLNQLTTEKENLQRQLEEKERQVEVGSAELREEISKLQAALQAKHDEDAAREEELNSIVSMNEILMGRISELESSGSASPDRDSLLVAAEKRNHELESEIRRLHNEIESMSSEYCKAQLSDQRDDSDLQFLVDEKDQEIEQLKEQFRKLESGYSASVQATIRAKDEEINDLRNRIELMEANSGNDETIENLANELAEKDDVIATLKEQIEKLQDESGNIATTITTLSKQLDEKDEYIESLDQQLQKAGEVIKQLEDIETRSQSLQLQLDERPTFDALQTLKQEVVDLKSEVNEKDEKIASLELRVEESQSVIAEKDESLALCEAKIEELQQSSVETTTRNSDLDEELKKLNNQFMQAQTMIQTLSTEKHSLEQQTADQSHHIDQLEAEYKVLQERINVSAEEQRDKLIEQLQNIEDENNELKQRSLEADRLEDRVRELQDEVKQSQMMADTFKKMEEMMKQQLNEANKLNQCLCEQIRTYDPQSPVKKTSISCSPMKFADSGADEVSEETEQLKTIIRAKDREMEVLRETVALAEEMNAKRCAELKELHAKFYDVTTRSHDLQKLSETQAKEINTLDQRAKLMSAKCEEEAKTNFELASKMRRVNDELIAAKRALEQERQNHTQFTSNLGSILNCSTESKILNTVVGLAQHHTHESGVRNASALTTHMKYLAEKHMSKMEAFARSVGNKTDLVSTSAVRMQRIVHSSAKKKETSHSVIASPFSSSVKPPSVLRRSKRDNMEAQTCHDFAHLAKVVFAPRAQPVGLESLTPRPKAPLFV